MENLETEIVVAPMDQIWDLNLPFPAIDDKNEILFRVIIWSRRQGKPKQIKDVFELYGPSLGRLQHHAKMCGGRITTKMWREAYSKAKEKHEESQHHLSNS